MQRFYDYCADIDECASSPCVNGATCNNMINKFTCTCASGFLGILCEIGMKDLLQHVYVNVVVITCKKTTFII